MNKRKTIAIILAQPEEMYQSHLLSGITERAFALDYDCAVFSIAYKDFTSDEIYDGAANIFRIINFDKMDAVIIVPDTIKSQRSVELARELIKTKFDGPVVTLDMELEDFESLMSDDASSIEAVCDHLIDVHGFSVIDFMSGIPDHPHSLRREEGYRRSLKKHGIEVNERRIHDGDFWYNKGADVADEIISAANGDEPLPMPQAVVCANDTMAISLCDAFKERGINVPEQIAVMGYDSLEEGREHRPSIASAELPAKQLGKNAVNHIHAKLNGTTFEPSEFEILLLPAQSCGCGGNSAPSKRSENFMYTDSNFRSFVRSTSNDMMSKLISDDDLHSVLYDIGWYTFQMRPFTAFMLMLSEDWLSGGDEDDEYRTVGYHDNIHMSLLNREKVDDAHIDDIVFDRSLMIPDSETDREKPAVYYFTALHFFDRCFGYAVLVYENETRTPPVDYRDWLRYVCNGIECLRRSLHIRKMYERLKIYADTDSLTGLLNRNAFNRYVEKLGEKAAKKPRRVMLMMCDLNFLKLINDTFGHVSGDEALRTVANAISSVCVKEKCFRFGGDEYMIMGEGDYDDERIAEITEGIDAYLKD